MLRSVSTSRTLGWVKTLCLTSISMFMIIVMIRLSPHTFVWTFCSVDIIYMQVQCGHGEGRRWSICKRHLPLVSSSKYNALRSLNDGQLFPEWCPNVPWMMQNIPWIMQNVPWIMLNSLRTYSWSTAEDVQRCCRSVSTMLNDGQTCSLNNGRQMFPEWWPIVPWMMPNVPWM